LTLLSPQGGGRWGMEIRDGWKNDYERWLDSDEEIWDAFDGESIVASVVVGLVFFGLLVTALVRLVLAGAG